MDARHSTVCKRSDAAIATYYTYSALAAVLRVYIYVASFSLMLFYLLFQQFLFVQGGSVGEPIFVIVGPIWSHEGILKENEKKISLFNLGPTFYVLYNLQLLVHFNSKKNTAI